MAVIKNTTPYTLISGTNSNDSIYNYLGDVTIEAGAGNDYIYNEGWGGDEDTVKINGNAGNDTIYNEGPEVKINGGSGNDCIYNDESYWVTINGGSGNDSIFNNGTGAIINAGTGNDVISLGTNATNNLINYTEGSGNDSVLGFNKSSTLQIGDGSSTFSTTKSGSDIIVAVGDEEITLVGAARLSKVKISNSWIVSGLYISKSNKDFASISGTSRNDCIYSYDGNWVTINAGDGNDSISNERGAFAKINAGDGNDSISNKGGSFIEINADAGNDSIFNNGTGAIINADDGNDSICNYGGYTTINTGAGNDSIFNDAYYTTINAGAANDLISLSSYSSNNLIQYVAGDGNDKIIGFDGNDTIQIGDGDGTYSTTSSGEDIIVTVDDGKITLVGAASLSAVNIVGEETPTEENSWTYNNGTAKYGTSDKTLVTVKGVKSVDGLKVDNKVVTVSNKSLNAKKVTISGDGYTLALADDVTAPTTSKKWSIDGSTATYNQTKTAGYKLANNAKSISYSKKSTTTLATVKGVKSTDGLSINGKVITIAESSVNKKKITLTSDEYTLKLADGLAPATKKATWSYKSGTATYKSSYKTAGYKLASNSKSISYSKATTAETLATVKGVKSKDGLSVSGKVVTVSDASVNEKKITISGDGYTLKLADGLAPTTKKPAWSYKSGTATYKSSYKTDGYNLAKNSKSITYSKATTATILATIKGAKSKTGLSVSGKKITLKNSALKNKVTVSGSYEFDFAKDYGTATIIGSSNADTITARGKKVSVNGGKGDDTIKILGSGTVSGGAGADIFYYKSSGSNIIADYAAEDKISIASGTAATSTSGDDLILTVGSGKISVTGGANETVTYYDSGGEHVYKKSSDTLAGVKFTKSGKVVTLTDDYEADRFDVADFGNYKNKIVTINAANVSQALEIVGNKKSNVITGTGAADYIDGGAGADSIKGGNGNDIIYGGTDNDSILGGNGSDTLSGGAGDDSLWGGVGSDSIYGGLGDDYLVGGDGRDIFVYNNGDGHDYIDDYEQGVDKIMILSGEKPYIDRTNLSNNVTYIIGEGSLVVQNGINTTIEFVDSNNRLIDKSTPSKAG